MAPPPDSGKYLDGVIVVFLLAGALFAPPLLTTWATPGSPWYLPYLVWLAVIVLIAFVQRLRKRYEL